MSVDEKVREAFSPFIVDSNLPLFEGGLSIKSIKFTELVLDLEETFDVDIDVDEIYCKKTLDEVTSYIEKLRKEG